MSNLTRQSIFSSITGSLAISTQLGRGACGALTLAGSLDGQQAVTKTAKVYGRDARMIMRREVRNHLRLHTMWVSNVPLVIDSTPDSITMEYLFGGTLSQFLEGYANGLISLEEMDSIVAAVAVAIKNVYSVGFLHGDLHTDNIYIVLEDGEWKAYLIDFGYSAFEDDEEDEYQHETYWDFPCKDKDMETLLAFIESDIRGAMPQDWLTSLFYAFFPQ